VARHYHFQNSKSCPRKAETWRRRKTHEPKTYKVQKQKLHLWPWQVELACTVPTRSPAAGCDSDARRLLLLPTFQDWLIHKPRKQRIYPRRLGTGETKQALCAYRHHRARSKVSKGEAPATQRIRELLCASGVVSCGHHCFAVAGMLVTSSFPETAASHQNGIPIKTNLLYLAIIISFHKLKTDYI